MKVSMLMSRETAGGFYGGTNATGRSRSRRAMVDTEPNLYFILRSDRMCEMAMQIRESIFRGRCFIVRPALSPVHLT
jgi:hypothetical protein